MGGETDSMEVDGSPKEDRRFNQQGRIGQKPRYTLDCGYGTTPVEDPWPVWVERNPDGTITVDFNSKSVSFPAHFPGMDFSKSNVFPFPWGNDAIAGPLTQKSFTDRLLNIIAGLPAVPFFMFRPPLWMLLNAVGVDKKRYETHNMSPVAISSKVIYCYLQVIHVLEGSTHAHNKTDIAKINTAHITDVKNLTEKINTMIGENAQFKELAVKVANNINGLPNEDMEGLEDFARYMVTFTMNYIKLLERKLLHLASKSLRPDDQPVNFFCEFGLPDPRNPRFTAFFDAQTDTMHTELMALLKLKYAQDEAALPVKPELVPANSIMGISVPALKLLLNYLYN